MNNAGKLLDKMLIAIQLQRYRDVFLTYLSEAKCLSCRIEIIQPKLIFAFGESTAQMITQSAASLDELRGKVHDCHGVALVVIFTCKFDGASTRQGLSLGRFVIGRGVDERF